MSAVGMDGLGNCRRRRVGWLTASAVVLVLACVALIVFIAGGRAGHVAGPGAIASPRSARCTEQSTVTTSGGRLTVCVNYQYLPGRHRIVFESVAATYRMARGTGGLANPQVNFLFWDPAHPKASYHLAGSHNFANSVYADQTKLVRLAGLPVQHLGSDLNLNLTANLVAEATSGSDPGTIYDVASLTVSLHPGGLCVNPGFQNNPPCVDTRI